VTGELPISHDLYLTKAAQQHKYTKCSSSQLFMFVVLRYANALEISVSL